MIFDDVIDRYAGNIGLLIGQHEGKVPEEYWESSSRVIDKMIAEKKSKDEIDYAIGILYPELESYNPNELEGKINKELRNVDECISRLKSYYSI
jgi:hypothetical protein